MMKIRKVALLGAGAIGSYVIWGLSKRDDIELGMIAEGERAQRLRENGMLINDQEYHPQVWSPKEAEGADLLIVALKYGALSGALDDIEKAAAGENTTVMSLMNGVDSEEIIAGRIGAEKLVYSIVKVASARKGNCVHFNPDNAGGVIFGEADAPYDTERVKAIMELFEGTGIRHRATEHIKPEMWKKFRLNVCNNLPQAILGAGIGCYKDSEHMAAIKKALGDELNAIAKAKGIDMSLAASSSTPGTDSKAARYSTLQDLDAKRHTEVDMFSGALVRMGRELGIPTPYNEYTYHMIKALEEKNDGLFDYE